MCLRFWRFAGLEGERSIEFEEVIQSIEELFEGFVCVRCFGDSQDSKMYSK